MNCGCIVGKYYPNIARRKDVKVYFAIVYVLTFLLWRLNISVADDTKAFLFARIASGNFVAVAAESE